jgi:hypothetical protein
LEEIPSNLSWTFLAESHILFFFAIGTTNQPDDASQGVQPGTAGSGVKASDQDLVILPLLSYGVCILSGSDRES